MTPAHDGAAAPAARWPWKGRRVGAGWRRAAAATAARRHPTPDPLQRREKDGTPTRDLVITHQASRKIKAFGPDPVKVRSVIRRR